MGCSAFPTAFPEECEGRGEDWWNECLRIFECLCRFRLGKYIEFPKVSEFSTEVIRKFCTKGMVTITF